MIRLQYRRDCDRCAHPFEDVIVADASELPTREGDRLRLLQGDDVVVFDWKDICPSCQKAVNGLIDRLRLNGPKKSKEPSAPQLLVEPAPFDDGNVIVEDPFTESAAAPSASHKPEHQPIE